MRRIISNIIPGTEWPVTYVITILGQEKKKSWFWSSGGSILMLIKKKLRAAKYNKTPFSPVKLF